MYKKVNILKLNSKFVTEVRKKVTNVCFKNIIMLRKTRIVLLIYLFMTILLKLHSVTKVSYNLCRNIKNDFKTYA